jgi:hypothetical protein
MSSVSGEWRRSVSLNTHSTFGSSFRQWALHLQQKHLAYVENSGRREIV